MEPERWIDLCNEGIKYASVAYEKAHIETPEEYIACCFRVLFTMLKEDGESHTVEPIKIK